MKKIEELFNDPSFGLLSQEKFFRKAKLKIPKLTRKEVNAFYKNQSAVQINTLKKRRKAFHHIIAPSVGSFQADILDMFKLGKLNKNFKYILTFIDIYSRRAWAYPLKRKKLENVEEAMKEWIESVKNKHEIRNITTDNGKEFLNLEVQELLEYNHIKHWVHEVGDHNVLGVNDRFHRTLRGLINRYFALKNTKRWIDVLPLLMKNYNSTEHRGINATPELVYNGKELPEIEFNTARRAAKGNIKIGDFVRIKNPKTKFSKGGNNFSKSIYEVSDIIGHKYIISGISQKLKPEDLLKVNKPTDIDKINTNKTIHKIEDLFPDKEKRELKLEREHKALDIKQTNVVRTKRKIKKNNKFFGDDFAN